MSAAAVDRIMGIADDYAHESCKNNEYNNQSRVDAARAKLLKALEEALNNPLRDR